jgi:hypothetical protein
MTKRTITAMFDRYADAAKAVGRLEAAGIPHDDISIVSNDASQREVAGGSATSHEGSDVGVGTGTGATLGTALGGGAGLLAGLGMLAIPGLGPVVAAGWLAATLVGAGVGAASGGLIGSLAGAGVDEKHAHSYAEAIHRGGTLVTARVDEAQYARAVDILDDDGAVDMDEREANWRLEGWTGKYSGGSDYAPGTTGSMSTGPVGAAASSTTGLGTSGAGMGSTGMGSTGMGSTGAAGMGSTTQDSQERTRSRVRSYPL